jgi:cytosine/adenosine deaminase-related metal-dependent hydrolase
MIRYHAAWVLPISGRPIADGWVEIDSGRVVGVGAGESHAPKPAAQRIDLGGVAVLPGLVNAHTHLELSYLHGRVPPSSDFVSWIRRVMAERRQRPDPEAPEILGAVDRTIADSLACGTALVGDISNTLVTFARLAASPLAAVVFYELIRFNATGAEELVDRAIGEIANLPPSDHVSVGLAAHAPYSVSPRLFACIRQAMDRRPGARCSVHLAESAEEVEFVRTGRGPWRTGLEEIGAWDPAWEPPGASPVEYLDRVGFLGERLLAVHGVQMTPDDLQCLARRGTFLVTCPRSNRYTGAGDAPIASFYESGVQVAVGTDSLAGAPDLNVFSELAVMRALAPGVPASKLLESATRQGARALGLSADFGSIDAGTRARLIAVSVPDGIVDVEEYLVSGIHPDQVTWLD